MLRQGEARIADLLTVSIAADERATALSSSFGALAAGLFAAVATILTIQKFDGAVTVSIGIAAIGSLIASFVCGYAGRPIDFFVGGYEPKSLIPSAVDEVWLLRYICQDVQRRIELDKKVLKQTALLTTVGTTVAIMSVLLGVVAFSLLHHWP
jgi:hypothetical protein